MPSRTTSAVLAVALAALALAAGVAASPAGARATWRADLMKTSLVALQASIEQDAAARMFVYAHPGAVRPGGLKSAFWPRDPWTGRMLTPGLTRGHYTYARGSDGRSYVLTGHLGGGRVFVVDGGMPHLPMLAYDHRGQEGLALIYQYVRLWSLLHPGRLPAPAQVTREGQVGQLRGVLMWPSNPWDHAAMQQRADRGSFSYARSEDGTTFTLRLHRATKGDYVLTGGVSAGTAKVAR
jgi:hypothetical protein